MKLFISPPSETTWKINPSRLALALRERYPKISINEKTSTNGPSLEWECICSHGPVNGLLDHDMNTVVIQGDVRDCADMATWLRRAVPAEQQLIFYDETYSADGQLTQKTSSRDIAAMFLHEESNS